jgi:probable phosphoglycerate mutase
MRETPLLLIRHGPTEWNAAKRLQGRADIPLSDAGRRTVSSYVVPPAFRSFDWLVSPLLRTRQTAALLGLSARVEDRLVEMDYGVFEGRSVAELRAELGDAMIENEARGLDFTPPEGESPRQVQDRLAPLLAEIASRDHGPRDHGTHGDRPPGIATGCVTHKGVIRAVLAAATGWDMTGKPPVKLDWSSAHLFQLDPAGGVRLDRPNIALLPQTVTPQTVIPNTDPD